MRVIAGSLRGRRIRAPRGKGTRPTSDRVRESLFDLLGPLGSEAAVLDLFAGSGALGIEALSRGAAHATFVERASGALRAIRANLEALELESRARVIAGDAMHARGWPSGPFDLVLADPPYDSAAATRVLARAPAVLRPGGILALESEARASPPVPTETLALWKSRRYGDTEITLYRRREDPS